MSVYLFVPSVFGILLPYSTWAVAKFGRFHSTWVICLVTFYFACQCATLYIIEGHQHWRTLCTDKFLQRFRTAWVHVATHYLLLTKHWPSRELCTFTHAEQFSLVCCDTYSFFPLKYQSRSCGKWDKHACKNSHIVIISFLFTLPYVN